MKADGMEVYRIMVRKEWVTPKAVVEEFEANEYVAACWSVGCRNDTTFSDHRSNTPYGNHWSGTEGPYDRVFSHEGDCRDAGNNYFRGNSDGSGLQFVMETSSDQGNLAGGFDYWVDVNRNGIVDGNGRWGSDVFYWYTDNGSRRWNHWGYVQSVASSHANRS